MKTSVLCLIIDDDADDQEIFSLALAEVDNGFNCIFASHAAEALAILNNNIRPDYIFLDLNMPRVSGLECLKEIRSFNSFDTIPIVIYSTSSEDFYIKQALDAGAKGFITKPSTIGDLADALKNFFSSQVA